MQFSRGLLVSTMLGLVGCGGGHDHDHGNNQYNNPPTTPLAVVVDTNQTMTAPSPQGFGGQGIGVFVEYRAGGHWHVYWACDTSLSGAPCNFTVGISVTDSSIANATPTNFGPNDTMTSTTSQVSAATTTTTQVDTVDFDATAGGKITLQANIPSLPSDGSWFFFVQDGQVNGGYNGPLSDPLIFEPSTP
jgi:hypothetical protein